MEIDINALSRRNLVAGGAALGGGALLTAAGAATASAAPPPSPSQIGPNTTREPMTDPGGGRIGSAAIGGYTYYHCDWMDFHTQLSTPRAFGSAGGVYANPADYMGASVDLSPGAIVRDVEFYVSATTAMPVVVHLWTTGGLPGPAIASGSVPAAAAGLRAYRLTVPTAGNGPYALGAKLTVWAYTDGTRAINGARVGLSSTPTGTVMLATPTRVYDSRSGAKIGNGQTRIHSLASRIPAGATSAILNVSVAAGEKSGGFAVYNTGSSAPSGSALYFSGSTIVSNEIHTKLPSDRKFKVTMRGVSGSKAHYFIDLVGYTA